MKIKLEKTMNFQNLAVKSIVFLFFAFAIAGRSDGQFRMLQHKETSLISEYQQPGTKSIQTNIKIFNFEDFSLGNLPDSWETTVTGKGKPGDWKIVSDKNENGKSKILAQTSMENFGYHFDVAYVKETNFKDLILTVNFKAIKGKEDQGGGPVWRYQDANNYYIARANPLENNFRVYKIINGNRKQLKSYSLPITKEQWHTIKIKHIDNNIKCYYDGQLYLEVDDETFKNPGKIGVWTKADSYCYFDDLKVEVK